MGSFTDNGFKDETRLPAGTQLTPSHIQKEVPVATATSYNLSPRRFDSRGSDDLLTLVGKPGFGIEQ